MDIPAICLNAGTFVGSVIAALVASKASTRSKSAEASAGVVKEQILGPGAEPSVRQLILDTGTALSAHREEVSRSAEVLHKDMAEMTKRIGDLENAVFTHVEKRLTKVEDVVYEQFRARSTVKRKIKR